MGSSSRLRSTTAFSLLLIFAVGLVLLGSTKLTTLAADTSLKLSTKAEHSSAAQASSCGVWNVVPSPNIGTGQNQLLGVTAISATNVWAVGDSTNSLGYDQTLTEQWNGANWSVVSSPNSGIGYNYLEGVAAVSANNIWAVGAYPYNNYYQPLIERWNGTSWNVVSSPNVGSYANYLEGVTAVSANNIWAVGWYENSMNGPIQSLIERWNGTSWNVVSNPNPAAGADALNGIARIAGTSQLVTVGTSANSIYGIDQTLIEQWNGTNWNVVSSPNVGSYANYLDGVAAVSANNIWAVGAYNNSVNWQILIEQWNGTNWNVVSSPNPGTNSDFLRSVARVPRTNQVWAVGYDNTSSNGPYQTLIEFYC